MSAMLTILAPLLAVQAPPVCELHVWPTKLYNAVFHGASVGSYNGAGTGLSLYLSPMDQVAAKLSKSMTEADQEAAIRSVVATPGGKFSGYQLVFHPAPEKSKYGNWIDKNVGVGGRDVASASPCYAEMHVIFITLFRTTISKKIQTGFIYREFGASQTMTRKAVDAGSTGAPGFTTDGDVPTEQAKADLRAAFRENVAIFMRKKKMR